jgi:hypothetical protein
MQQSESVTSTDEAYCRVHPPIPVKASKGAKTARNCDAFTEIISRDEAKIANKALCDAMMQKKRIKFSTTTIGKERLGKAETKISQ